MIRFFVVCVLIFNFVTSASFAKSVPTEVELTYQVIVNGKSMTDGPKLMLLAGESASRSWTETNSKKLLPQIAQEINYIDFPAQETFQVARFADGKMINTSSKFSEYPPLTETGETAKILGYPCKHVKTSLRSNSIDIWYTTDLNVKGTPSMAYGIPDGLVLKIVRNGNYEMVATDLKKLKTKASAWICLNTATKLPKG
jgi:GLPGLI family protein